MNRGPFKPTWESLEGFKVPEWYVDGKFGIFIHWGVYSVPAFGNEWYPRNMYKADTDEFKHHVATYGLMIRAGFSRRQVVWRGDLCAGVPAAAGLVEHGFARPWCGTCRISVLVPFSRRGRSFCPSCEKKKQLLWAEWLREKLLAPVPHRHVVLTMPRLLRPLFRRRRELLGELSQAGAEAVAQATRARLGEDVRPGIVVSIASAGDLLQWHPHLHIITTDGGFSSDGNEVDPLQCRKCGGPLKIVAYINDQISIKRILDHLGLSPPEQEKPPPAVHEVVRVPVDEEDREMEAP